jgi:hypothetical protein
MQLDGIRFGFEQAYAEYFLQDGIGIPAELQPLPNLPSERIRRKLLMDHLQLSPNMAPEVCARAEHSAKRLGVTAPVELYQASGPCNAANLLNPDVCFISFRGDMITLLDEGAMLALFGHEMGHHLCHTTFASDKIRTFHHIASWMAGNESLGPELRRAFSRLSMAKEFTADRFAALAAGGLDGAVRLMMSVVTGLPSHRLERDQEVYVKQALSLFGEGSDEGILHLGSHPEHLLRTYALSLFAETDAFRTLTGQGSGTRNLRDVDAHLDQILNRGSLGIPSRESDEPMSPELMGFSCCAAVLMALSDGDLGDDELQALEDTFSHALPDWKVLLDPRRALEGYSEFLPLVAQGGESAAVSVFNIMLHIMLADRVVYGREIEMLHRVGRSLGQGKLFEHLMASVARDLRIELDGDAEGTDTLPALPAGSRETQDALKGLLSGLARRGGGVLLVGRLLKIMGEREWTAESRKRLETTLRGVPLEIPSLPPPINGEVPPEILNQNIEFRLTEAERQRREAEALQAQTHALARAQSKDGLVSALGYLRERLVDGDGRSPSIRLYKMRNSRHVDVVRLDRVVSDRSERVVTMLDASRNIPLLSAEEADRDRGSRSLATALRELHREANARVEETGRRDVFVGYPFLEGVVNGYYVRAPLVLHPFDLVGDGRGAGTYALKRREDEPPFANQALLRLVFAKKGFPCTDETNRVLDAAAAESPEALIAALAKVGLALAVPEEPLAEFPDLEAAATTLLGEGLAVRTFAVLGFFPQSSSDLLKDYDDLIQQIKAPDGLPLNQLLHAACQVLPPSLRGDVPPPATEASADQPVIFADPSQRAAVRAARSSRLLVMDGPPGTGKSQTIVNLVADTLAHGGKVGIVCEKRVALDVVKHRLDSSGLGHLALVVHDVADDRKAVCQHVAARLESTERRQWDAVHLSELRREAASLETSARERLALLRALDGEGFSVHRLHLIAAGSRGMPVVRVEGLAAIPASALAEAMGALRTLSREAGLFGTTSALRAPPGEQKRVSLAAATSEELQDITEWLHRLRHAAAKYEAARYELPLAWEVLENAGPFLEKLCKGPDPDRLHAALFTAALAPGNGQSIRVELSKSLKRHHKALERFPQSVRFQDLPTLRKALSAASLRVGSPFRIFSSAWRSAASTIKAALIADWPEQVSAKINAAFLAELSLRADAASVWELVEEHWTVLVPGMAMPDSGKDLWEAMGQLDERGEWVAALQNERNHAVAASLWIDESRPSYTPEILAGWKRNATPALRLLALQHKYRDELHVGDSIFPYVYSLGASGIASLADTFVPNAVRIQRADQTLDLLSPWLPNPLDLAEALADASLSHETLDWGDALLAAWARDRLDKWKESTPSAGTLDQPLALGSMEELSDRLLRLHVEIAAEEAKRLAAHADSQGLMAVDPAAPKARRTQAQSDREALLRECNKKRNLMPLRGLVRSFADKGLLDVAPVWLMSPETTAILFPREPIFDLLIVDEASQCTVEGGLPVLTRARRAVVSGDERQMPPTSFFKAAAGVEVAEDSPGQNGEAPDIAADALGDESLLALARGAGDPSPLRWHYRSLYEELIAFSNHAMYGGQLLTIPSIRSRSAAPALHWMDVPDGVWEDGCNRVEAEKVVDVLGEILSRPDAPSVGVVTFNLKQRQAIFNAIDARRFSDERFAAAYDHAASREDLDQRPFVKKPGVGPRGRKGCHRVFPRLRPRDNETERRFGTPLCSVPFWSAGPERRRATPQRGRLPRQAGSGGPRFLRSGPPLRGQQQA